MHACEARRSVVVIGRCGDLVRLNSRIRIRVLHNRRTRIQQEVYFKVVNEQAEEHAVQDLAQRVEAPAPSAVHGPRGEQDEHGVQTEQHFRDESVTRVRADKAVHYVKLTHLTRPSLRRLKILELKYQCVSSGDLFKLTKMYRMDKSWKVWKAE